MVGMVGMVGFSERRMGKGVVWPPSPAVRVASARSRLCAPPPPPPARGHRNCASFHLLSLHQHVHVPPPHTPYTQLELAAARGVAPLIQRLPMNKARVHAPVAVGAVTGPCLEHDQPRMKLNTHATCVQADEALDMVAKGRAHYRVVLCADMK